MKKRLLMICLALSLTLGLLSGCSSGVSSNQTGLVDTATLVSEASSVETSIAVDIVARVISNSSSNGHKASLSSYITINSNSSPMAYYADLFSRINVDDVESTEEKEIYVVPSEETNAYLKYEYVADKDEWEMYELPVAEVMALPTKTGYDFDWGLFTSNVSLSSDSVESNKVDCSLYTGETNSDILQYFFGNSVFNSFMYSVEMLLDDKIPFELYISNETNYPVEIIFDISGAFIVSDMSFDKAEITVKYDNWNSVQEVEVPKKVSVVATEPVKNLYNSFYAWNLFLPYVNGITSSGGPSGSSLGTFQSLWNTYQFRLDNYLSALPISYEDMTKLGYKVDSNKTSLIIEPNQYVENIGIYKGSDKLICSIYNDTTSAQPITACKIGSIDLSVANNNTNSITLYLPGEIHLGVSRDDIYAAYGSPNDVTTSFAADLCTWAGEDDRHCLIAEISPANQQVIRIHLKNIPVTGGSQ